jgi:hypothetical protein
MGFSDRQKKIVIPVQFDTVYPFGVYAMHLEIQPSRDYALVKKKGKEYWVNKAGKLLDIKAGEVPRQETAEMIGGIGGGTVIEQVPQSRNFVFTDEQTQLKGLIVK